jgi:hypothetical protein
MDIIAKRRLYKTLHMKFSRQYSTIIRDCERKINTLEQRHLQLVQLKEIVSESIFNKMSEWDQIVLERKLYLLTNNSRHVKDIGLIVGVDTHSPTTILR